MLYHTSPVLSLSVLQQPEAGAEPGHSQAGFSGSMEEPARSQLAFCGTTDEFRQSQLAFSSTADESGQSQLAFCSTTDESRQSQLAFSSTADELGQSQLAFCGTGDGPRECQLAFSGATDGSLGVWDVTSPCAPVLALRDMHQSGINALSVSRCGAPSWGMLFMLPTVRRTCAQVMSRQGER